MTRRTVTCHIVDLALSPGALARCDAVLDADERARGDRYRRAADRDRHRASHAALRLLLGRALGREPAALRFAVGPAGKPALAGDDAGDLAFNLSHSGALGLVGLCRGAPVGVDVEVIRPLPDALRIAAAHFAPDEAGALAALPPRAQEAAFFGLWTRKEAVAKAMGEGLALPLARFSVSPPPEPPRLLGVGGWTLAEIDAGPAAAAALAVRAAPAAVESRRLPPDWPDRL